MEVLLDPQSREILAHFLKDFERPKTIAPEDWREYRRGERAMITFKDLGEICDVCGVGILATLKLSKKEVSSEII